MNKAILLLLVLFAISQCQELVLSSWEGQYTTGQRFEKSFQRPEWNNEKDIAIYGWFKFNSALSRSQWSVLVHFTHNPEGIFVNQHYPGDRSIAAFAINNQIYPATYTTGNNNYYSSVNYGKNDLDNWAFFYLAHGSGQSRFRFYFKFQNSVGQGILQKIVHTTSNYYKIMLGQSVSYKFFQGQIANVYIHVGNTAYRETGYEALQDNSNPVYPSLPNPLPSCITIYYECYFKGEPISVCSTVNNLDTSKIKSIYVPPNKWFTLYGANDFSGKTVKFSQTEKCIDKLNWSLIEVSSQKKHLKKNKN